MQQRKLLQVEKTKISGRKLVRASCIFLFREKERTPTFKAISYKINNNKTLNKCTLVFQIVPSPRPGSIIMQDWQLENFPNLAENSNPAEGIKSPLFSLLRAIAVPKMSSARNIGFSFPMRETAPLLRTYGMYR